MGIYYLPENAVFREDFFSPGTIAANGGVITGSGVANKRFLPTAASDLISYKLQGSYLFRQNILTICAVTKLTDFTGSYRNLLYLAGATNAKYEIGLNNSSNKLFWYNTAAITLSTSSFTASNKSSLVYVYDGSNIIFYVDGISLGTIATVASTQGEGVYNLVIGNKAGATPFSNPIYTVQIYNKAFTATDALDWHRMAQEKY